LLDSVRDLADGLVGSLHDRLALFAVEFHEEKLRLMRAFLWLGAAFATALLTVIFLSLTIVYCCPAGSRLVVLVALTLAYGVALAAIIIGAQRHFAREARPFSATLEELARDRECIRPEN